MQKQDSKKQDSKELKKFKVLVSANPKYKSKAEKKLVKLEMKYEKTPKECVLKRAKLIKQAKRLI